MTARARPARSVSLPPAARAHSPRPVIALLLLAGLVAAVFGRSVYFDFVGFDDNVHVVHNPYFDPVSLHHLATLWRSAYEQVYMPVTYTLWAIVAKLGEVATPDESGARFNPYLFHAVNLLLHGCSVLLVWRILGRVIGQTWAAVLGAAVFAVHPLQVEAVAWVSSMKDLLGGFFALAAVLLFLRFAAVVEPEEGKSARRRAAVWYLLALLAFGLALLAKATTVVTPAVLVVLLVLRRPWNRPATRWLAVWFLAIPPVLWATHANQSDAALLVWSPPWSRPVVANDAVAFYGEKLLVPVHLAVDYGRTPQWVVHGPIQWGWVLPVLVGATLVALRRCWPEGLAGGVIFVVGLLPVLGFVPFEFQGYSTVADRYVYLPMLGVALGAGGLVRGAVQVEARRGGRGGLVVAAGWAVLGVLAAASWQQVGVWRDSATLFAHAVEVVPRSGFGWQGVGLVREQAGDLPGAAAAYGQAVRIRPDDLQALTGLARTLAKIRPDERAAQAYAAVTLEAARRVLLKFPHDALAYRKMGTAFTIEHRYGEAVAAYRQSISDNPSDAATHAEYGQLLAATGHPVEAEAERQIAAGRLHH